VVHGLAAFRRQRYEIVRVSRHDSSMSFPYNGQSVGQSHMRARICLRVTLIVPL
jgi:hypothetical protein